jgi:hypothetical protein
MSANRGGLNPFERQKIMKRVDQVVIASLDKNGDGELLKEEVGLPLWLFGMSMSIDSDKNEKVDRDEVNRFLDSMDNPLDLLENPLVRGIPEVAKLLNRMEGKR